MKKILATLAVVMTAGFAANASATVITLSGPGVTTTSVAGATVVDFSNGCGAYTSCTGDFQIVSGSVIGRYAQPAGTTAPYLTVPNPIRSGSATFTLGFNANYFGLYWGSVDAYNSISFLLGSEVVGNYGGADVVGAANANGNQVSSKSNVYVNFDFGNFFFDTVVLSSNGFAFESVNHAFANTTAVPEPGTLLLFGLGLVGLGVARRKQKSA
jgi:hypothetical protein